MKLAYSVEPQSVGILLLNGSSYNFTSFIFCSLEELIKDIEDVLQMTVQNKRRGVEDKPAT